MSVFFNIFLEFSYEDFEKNGQIKFLEKNWLIFGVDFRVGKIYGKISDQYDERDIIEPQVIREIMPLIEKNSGSRKTRRWFVGVVLGSLEVILLFFLLLLLFYFEERI